jgi:hypothetical protein
MRDRLTDPQTRHDVVAIPTIWLAIALSLLVHLAVLWTWKPEILFPSAEGPERGKSGGSLQVRIAPPPSPPPAPPPAPALVPKPSPTPQARPSPPVPAPQPAPQARPPKAPARPAPAPPVIALNKPSAKSPTPAPVVPPAAAPAPAPTPPQGDFASLLDAKRRARTESAPPPSPPSPSTQPSAEDDAARSDRIVAANLGTQRAPTFGYDPSRGGGIFQIKRMTYDDAEFVFFGWNRDIRRNTAQLIEVRRGNNRDIRIAVVRKIIAIIREYEQEEFLWESKRLGRNLTLSARAKDNAGLEDFMMREFFDAPPP